MAASTPGDSAKIASEPGALQKVYKKYSEVSTKVMNSHSVVIQINYVN